MDENEFKYSKCISKLDGRNFRQAIPTSKNFETWTRPGNNNGRLNRRAYARTRGLQYGKKDRPQNARERDIVSETTTARFWNYHASNNRGGHASVIYVGLFSLALTQKCRQINVAMKGVVHHRNFRSSRCDSSRSKIAPIRYVGSMLTVWHSALECYMELSIWMTTTSSAWPPAICSAQKGGFWKESYPGRLGELDDHEEEETFIWSYWRIEGKM